MRLRFAGHGARAHNLHGRPMPAGAVEMLDRLIEDLGVEGTPWLYMSLFGAGEMGTQVEPWCLTTPMDRDLDGWAYFAKWEDDRWCVVRLLGSAREIVHRGPRYEP